MQSTPPVDVPTPRTDAADTVIPSDLEDPCRFNAKRVHADFARQLERELIAATAELERTKEQLRVAREGLYMCIEMASTDIVHRVAKDALRKVDNFTQPQSGAVDPVKGEEG